MCLFPFGFRLILAAPGRIRITQVQLVQYAPRQPRSEVVPDVGQGAQQGVDAHGLIDESAYPPWPRRAQADRGHRLSRCDGVIIGVDTSGMWMLVNVT